MRLTIVTKGLLLVALGLLFQLAFIALVAFMQRQHIEAEDWSSHSTEVMAQTETVLRTVLDAQASMRGYILTEDETFARPYQAATQQLPAALQRLRSLVQDNPEQIRRNDKIIAVTEQFMVTLSTVDSLMRAGQHDSATQWVKDQHGLKSMESVRAAIDDFQQHEQLLVDQRQRTLQTSRRALQWLLGLGSLLAFALTGVLAWLFSRGISGRLAVLAHNATRVTLKQPLAPLVRGTDEIARLDQVLHEMADSLAAAADREQQYTSQLEDRIRERTADLRRINSDLAQQNQENETFVYSVSHDLRSPLVNLQGFSNELGLVCSEIRQIIDAPHLPADARKRGLEMVDHDMARSIAFIQTAVMRLSGIIDALLRLSRAGRIDYQLQQIDVRALVGRIAESMSVTAFDHGAEIRIHPLPSVWADPTALEQVFANLIGNALNYLDSRRPGLVEIGVVTNETLPASDLPAGPVFYVKDNGLGIAAEYVPKVFQAFKRLHPNVARGEGMGLAIVRRAVERHSGRIWVESVVGVGSTFFVALPDQAPHTLHSDLGQLSDERNHTHDVRPTRNPVSGR